MLLSLLSFIVAITLGATGWQSNSATSTTVSYTYNGVSTGSVLVMCAGCANTGAETLSASDNNGGSWASITSDTNAALTSKCQMFYAYNVAAGNPIITLTSTISRNIGLLVVELIGCTTTDPLDGSNHNTHSISSETPTPGAITTTVDGAVIGHLVCYVAPISGAGTGYTAGATYTQSYPFGTQHKLGATAGSNTASWANARTYYVALAAAFKAASTGGVVGSYYYRQVAGMHTGGG